MIDIFCSISIAIKSSVYFARFVANKLTLAQNMSPNSFNTLAIH